MMDIRDVERENKVYVNDRVLVLDENDITPSQLLELADYSSLVYELYFKGGDYINNDKKTKKKNKENRPLKSNKKIKINSGMRFNAILKQD